jgi:predicted ATP-binding protein involved in virulence
MRITKLRLENFLSFKEELELGDLTILVRPNGAGLGAPTSAVQFYYFMSYFMSFLSIIMHIIVK